MSESEWYWPTENGTYEVDAPDWVETWILRDGQWLFNESSAFAWTAEELKAAGYLGVRREPERLTPSDTAEILARSAEDNAAIAKQAREELRLCRRSYEFERWAIKWGPVLCQMLGAE